MSAAYLYLPLFIHKSPTKSKYTLGIYVKAVLSQHYDCVAWVRGWSLLVVCSGAAVYLGVP